MALIPSLNRSTTASSKGVKTKAKQRYLRAKKNRSKKKRGKQKDTGSHLLSTSHQREIASFSGDSVTSSDDEDSSDGVRDENEANSLTVSVADAGSSPATRSSPTQAQRFQHFSKPATDRRPKKRRRLETACSPDSGSTKLPKSISSNVMDVDESQNTTQSSVSSHLVSGIQADVGYDTKDANAVREELPALPRFPLPRQPEAPSPAVLYLQGVDEALIEAEVVDPAQTLSFSTEATVDASGLSLKARQRLSQLGISELFAVQTAILPFLLTSRSPHALYSPYNRLRDLCVSAPTGSGKTLAYVLPIIETLSTRIVTRLRALIVLPTRDLVSQVRETFEALCQGRNIRIGVATGQHSFAHEQAQLVGDTPRSEGGHSKVDILVCTPGRLMDHLQGTPNFTLQHLRFLVIDEADRLVTEAFQDWLAQVLAATHPAPSRTAPEKTASGDHLVPRCDALHPAWIPYSSRLSIVTTDVHETKYSSCQKLLFSATLTRDPSKISALNLTHPKYFVVGSENAVGISELGDEPIGETFTFPASLNEHMVVCDTSLKPLILLYLMHARGVTNALIFTKSAESTARLVKLIQAFEQSLASSMDVNPKSETSGIDRTTTVAAEAYSSDLSASQRKTILERFRNAEIGILVCSDLISRGIDISHVSHVVSYDAPVDMRKYVHRVGRTARAGREGNAWSLVEEQEARHFKKMMLEARHLDQLTKVKVPPKALEPYQPHYEYSLDKLRAVYGR